MVRRIRLLQRRLVREPLPADRIAAGWALGMFIGCAVPFGLQLIVSVPLSIMMKVSKVGATVGTLITNPITILFIYPAQTWAMYNLIFGARSLQAMPKEWTWDSVRALGIDVMASFLLGGLALALILSPLTYVFVKRLVVRYRAKMAVKEGKAQDDFAGED